MSQIAFDGTEERSEAFFRKVVLSMEKKAVAVTVVAALLGILSAAIGFALEAIRVKYGNRELWEYGGFVSRDYRAVAGSLALAAACLLLAAHLIIQGFAGCICCLNDRDESTFKSLTSVVSSLAWTLCVISMVLLIREALYYRSEILTGAGRLSFNCCYVPPGIAGSGAALALISVVLGIVYYHMAEGLRKGAHIRAEEFTSEIPLAQPQFPAQSPEVTCN